ncbi:MAG: DUF255 domain-containing protein [Planctomycetales bacterium]|nr:DUF255 domain-containing protein [Planctomycetales bacterium]
MTMRRYLLIAALLALSASTWSSASVAAQIAWQTDFESALQQAHAQNRPLLLHFWTPECVPCRRLEQKVFNQARVAETMGDFFVPVKINANAHPELAARYKIETVPTDVIVGPNREVLHQLCTPQDPEQYVAQLSAIAFRTGTTASPTGPAGRRGATQVADRSDAKQDSYANIPADGRYANGSVFSPEGRTNATSLAAVEAEPVNNVVVTNPTADANVEPTEVINRFATRSRGQDQPADRDNVDAPAVASNQEPAARKSPSSQRWGGWDDSQDQYAQAVADDAPTESRTSRPTASAVAETAPSPTARDTRNEDTRVAARKTTQMGLDGYCPVSLLRNEKWVKGDPKFGVVHRGRTYLFAGEEEKALFWSDPDEYSPVLAGLDPVMLTDAGETVAGRREHGVVYRKRVYLFSSEDSLERFWQDPERFASPIRQAMESGDVGRLFR